MSVNILVQGKYMHYEVRYVSLVRRKQNSHWQTQRKAKKRAEPQKQLTWGSGITLGANIGGSQGQRKSWWPDLERLGPQ